jgi:hypothetical protein
MVGTIEQRRRSLRFLHIKPINCGIMGRLVYLLLCLSFSIPKERREIFYNSPVSRAARLTSQCKYDKR